MPDSYQTQAQRCTYKTQLLLRWPRYWWVEGAESVGSRRPDLMLTKLWVRPWGGTKNDSLSSHSNSPHFILTWCMDLVIHINIRLGVIFFVSVSIMWRFVGVITRPSFLAWCEPPRVSGFKCNHRINKYIHVTGLPFLLMFWWWKALCGAPRPGEGQVAVWVTPSSAFRHYMCDCWDWPIKIHLLI